MTNKSDKIHNVRLALGHFIKMTDEEFRGLGVDPTPGFYLELDVKEPGNQFTMTQKVISIVPANGFVTLHITSDGLPKNCEYDAVVRVRKPGTITAK